MDLVNDLGALRELTVQGLLLIGLIMTFRENKKREAIIKKEASDREEDFRKRLEEKDKCIFRIMDKNAEILNKLEKIYDHQK